ETDARDAVDRTQEERRGEPRNQESDEPDRQEDRERQTDGRDQARGEKAESRPADQQARERLRPPDQQQPGDHEPGEPEGLASEPAPEPPETEESQEQQETSVDPRHLRCPPPNSPVRQWRIVTPLDCVRYVEWRACAPPWPSSSVARWASRSVPACGAPRVSQLSHTVS